MEINPTISLWTRLRQAFVLTLMAVMAPLANASTLWTGPTTNYVQPLPDPTQAANQDRLTARVWLTRGQTEGLFNAVQESSYDRPEDNDPTDTEWAYGGLSNYASLTYTTWAGMSGNNPPSMVGQEAVLHLITDDIYLSISFTFWGTMGGGFAYNRSTPAIVSPTLSVAITNPSTGAVFAAPASVHIGAEATMSGGLVTNMAFFSNALLLGSAQAAPFSITVSNLAAGAYPLTAVATAAGVSATSAAVNISVVSPVAVSLSRPQVTGSQFSFNYTANSGLSYVIENSSNLINWLPVATNVASSNLSQFTDRFISNSSRYYRVGRLPNP